MSKINENYLSLVVDHTCWWKAKKFRKESANFLKRKKKDGWRLRKSILIKKKLTTIDTKTYKAYFFYK